MKLSKKIITGAGLAGLCITLSLTNPKKAECNPSEISRISQVPQQTESNYQETNNISWIQKNKAYLIGGILFTFIVAPPLIRGYQRKIHNEVNNIYS